MALPTLSDLVSGTTTEGEFQAALTTLYNHIAVTIGSEAPEEIDIVLGEITPTRGLIKVDTENSSPTDNLDHITPTNLGERLVMVQSTDASRVITLKHNVSGSGKLMLLDDADAVLSDVNQFVLLRYSQSADAWYELNRNFGILAPTAAIKQSIRTKLGILDIATKAIGTSSGQVPTADLLGALAFLNTIGTSQIVDDAITGAKVLNGSLSLAKIANGTPGYFMGFNETTGVPEEREVSLEVPTPPAPQLFTSSSTWTKPADWTGRIRVTVVGSGGPSGSTSSFGSHCSASGGGQPTGGIGSGGDVNIRGGYGQAGMPNSDAVDPIGGHNMFGGYGQGNAGRSDKPPYDGAGPLTSGGAGGVAIKWINEADLGATESVTVGTANANGVVFVEYF